MAEDVGGQPDTRQVASKRGLVTMSDVAKEAKLSRATVSKIINKSGYARPETVARVNEVIRRMGYRPNEMARSLVRQKSFAIGIIFSSTADPWAGEILEFITPMARDYSYHLILYPATDASADIQYCVDSVMSWRVDAVISFIKLDERSLSEITTQGTTVVSWGYPCAEVPHLMFVCVDIELGLSRIATYLSRLNHRCLGYISYGDDLAPAVLRAMHSVGVNNVVMQKCGNHTVQAGAEAVTELISTAHQRPTAVVCRTDTLAFGALSGLDRMGIKVPDEISVVGINDVQMAQFTKPPLTTLRISPRVVAKRLLDTTLAALCGQETPLFQAITPELIVRESTAPAIT